ncbi:MAG: protein-L-isoaspartate(D-aspartate) O-methyltransferase [Mariprofundaceae bacterium]|nr:protein-L-isoaspartate(D-aspartate) O-methyltransferase [Mariprofundaceae bacterium]
MAFEALRESMVTHQIEARGVRNAHVLAAMRAVPRHAFVPDVAPEEAYADHPLPIGHGQTISQPYIVAYMCEAAALTADCRALEVGTGCGYNAAVMSQLAGHVYTAEIVPELATRAAQTLEALGYLNVSVKTGDGCTIWQDEAPFDAIIVTAAPPKIPDILLAQLSDGGRLVIPVGNLFMGQELLLVERKGDEYIRQHKMLVSFVPLRGPEAE